VNFIFGDVDVKGRLAEIIILDQFSRNIYRHKPEAFANDTLVLCLAQETVSRILDVDLNPTEQAFLYMPYMHSESSIIHDEAMRKLAFFLPQALLFRAQVIFRTEKVNCLDGRPLCMASINWD
jgi:uncharacterized protein (DUF924 family)